MRDRHIEMSRALSAFHGDSAETAEADALRRLKDLLDSSVASQKIVEETYKRFTAAGGSEQSDLTAFLIAAADKQALPTSVMTMLLEKVGDAVSRHEREFMDTEYARVLAHGMSQVPEASRPPAYRLIASVARAVTPTASSTAEIYASLGRQGLDTPEMFQWVLSQARAAPPYRPQNPELVAEPLPGLSIVVGYGPWLEALAVIAANRTIPHEAIETLERHVGEPTLRDAILRALVRQPDSQEQTCWRNSRSRILKAFPKDGAKRQLLADIVSERLASLPRREFLPALEALRKERISETEPEIRIVLGLAVINAQLARVRTIPVGSRLFEPQQ